MKIHTTAKGVGLLFALASQSVIAADFGGPNSVENTLPKPEQSKPDRTKSKPQPSWREKAAEQGITLGADYTVFGVSSPDGSKGNNVNRASGAARFYGSWDLINRGEKDKGGLVWKVEHRHAFTDSSPKNYAFIDDVSGGPEGIGYVGMMGTPFSDQGFRVTNLHWKQKLNGGKTSVIAGWQDVTDYVDTYALASPWTGFTNLAFSTGAGAMGLPDDGVLALSVGHMLTDNIYVIGGIADANGKSDDILDGFNTAFDESEYFTSIELGWTASKDQIYTDNVHVTFWDFGENTRHSNATGEGGRGVNVSASWFATDNIMPFVRGGISEGDVALYDKSLSVGFGYFGLGKPENTLGAAVNWSETNETAFGGDEQITAEVFYNMQFGKHLQITPDIQFIKDPAFSSEDSAVVFGVRAKISL